MNNLLLIKSQKVLKERILKISIKEKKDNKSYIDSLQERYKILKSKETMVIFLPLKRKLK